MPQTTVLEPILIPGGQAAFGTQTHLTYDPVTGIYSSTVDDLCVCVSWTILFQVLNGPISTGSSNRLGQYQLQYFNNTQSGYSGDLGQLIELHDYTVDNSRTNSYFQTIHPVGHFILRFAGQGFRLAFAAQDATQLSFFLRGSQVQIITTV
jgi:hypothetical protein